MTVVFGTKVNGVPNPVGTSTASVFVNLRLRRTSDALEVDVIDDVGYPADDVHDLDGVRFMWSDGNYGCDCNRHLYFERALGNDPELGRVCSRRMYRVVAPDWLAEVAR